MISAELKTELFVISYLRNTLSDSEKSSDKESLRTLEMYTLSILSELFLSTLMRDQELVAVFLQAQTINDVVESLIKQFVPEIFIKGAASEFHETIRRKQLPKKRFLPVQDSPHRQVYTHPTGKIVKKRVYTRKDEIHAVIQQVKEMRSSFSKEEEEIKEWLNQNRVFIEGRELIFIKEIHKKIKREGGFSGATLAKFLSRLQSEFNIEKDKASTWKKNLISRADAYVMLYTSKAAGYTTPVELPELTENDDLSDPDKVLQFIAHLYLMQGNYYACLELLQTMEEKRYELLQDNVLSVLAATRAKIRFSTAEVEDTMQFLYDTVAEQEEETPLKYYLLSARQEELLANCLQAKKYLETLGAPYLEPYPVDQPLDECSELYKKIQFWGEEAERFLLYFNEGLAKAMTSEFHTNWITFRPLFDDVWQEAKKGLLKAVHQYNPDIARFSTFAAWKIRGALSAYSVKLQKTRFKEVYVDDDDDTSTREERGLWGVSSERHNPESILLDKELLFALRHKLEPLVALLTEEQKEAIFIYFGFPVENVYNVEPEALLDAVGSYTKTGVVLGITHQGVDHRVKGGLARIRRRLAENG